MNITVDCDLNAAWLNASDHPALIKLLAKAQRSLQAMPLEAWLCQQFALLAQPDYPIAAIAAHGDGLNASAGYWLRADPVHLVLQRDCFSLHEAFPLPLSPAHATALLASLNAHFNQDGLRFLQGQSGAWYVQLAQAPQIKTALPSVALDKNTANFLPQGNDASRWVSVLNEVQMLLHDHPVNALRSAQDDLAVNSVWFSGGGGLPTALTSNQAGLMANSPLYRGLAKLADLPMAAIAENCEAILHRPAQDLRVHLTCNSRLDEDWFAPLLLGLRQGRLSQLTLNLGFYEQTLLLAIRPRDLYKFWRRARPLAEYWA